MIIVSHRINAVGDLNTTPLQYGVEVDIRSDCGNLIIHHEPFSQGARFEEWLNAYRHRLLILNVKEEGLEQRILLLMAQYGIRDFFFLDQSFPFLLKTAKSGERRCAARISEFESIQTVLALKGLIDWVWVDCFNPGLWLSGADTHRLADAGFRLCLVSPELQGRSAEANIPLIRNKLQAEAMHIDAVCTKVPALWE